MYDTPVRLSATFERDVSRTFPALDEKPFSPPYSSATCRSDTMRRGWRIGDFRYSTHQTPPKGYSAFLGITCSRYLDRDAIMSTNVHIWYRPWASDAREAAIARLADKTKAEQKLRELSEKGGPVHERILSLRTRSEWSG